MKIKLVNLNLWQGGNLMEGIINFLNKEDADIVLLQEVYNEVDASKEERFRSLQVLQSHLNYPYIDFAPTFLEVLPGGNIDQGNAVLSKFPITDRSVTFFDTPYGERLEIPENFPTTPRNLQHVVITVDGQELNVFNFQGVWDLNGENFSEQRKKMSQVIINAVKGQPHAILAGDTNAKPVNQAMRNIEEHMHSVFGDSLATTFNMRRKTNPGYATAAVDMIFISQDIKVLETTCPNVDISDHLPQTMTFELIG